jgi:hypothetical protein
MEYTYEDVLVQCELVKDLLKIQKNRRNIDKRNYLIALLYYGFNKKEKEVAEILNMKRETVTSAKFHPYQLLKYKDAIFIENVEDIMKALPYDFPENNSAKASKKSTAITLHLDKEMIKKMRRYMEFKEINRMDVAIRNIITKALKLWEE